MEWRDLIKVIEKDNWFENNIIWRVGSRNLVRFWEDKWLGETTIIHRFSRLYSISTCQSKIIHEVVAQVTCHKLHIISIS